MCRNSHPILRCKGIFFFLINDTFCEIFFSLFYMCLFIRTFIPEIFSDSCPVFGLLLFFHSIIDMFSGKSRRLYSSCIEPVYSFHLLKFDPSSLPLASYLHRLVSARRVSKCCILHVRETVRTEIDTLAFD
jgi:hypothetical protein